MRMHRLRPERRVLQCSNIYPAAQSSCRALSRVSHHNETRTLSASKLPAFLSPSIPSRTFHYANSLSTTDDTIYALSTAPGRAAIAVIRISGPACLSIYEQLCPGRKHPKPRTATLRRLTNPIDRTDILDTGALILYFPAPNTVTGEDILELHVHGGPAIVRGVLDVIPRCTQMSTASRLQDGHRQLASVVKSRPAEPGEFTRRAFYNSRIDLTTVESLSESLSAETEQQRRLAVSGAASALTTRYECWRSMLLHARGELEALIDFSEDQHFDESPIELMHGTATQVRDLVRQIQLHITNSGRGELLRSGITVSLLGAPNAGKSSLLNRIVGREAAIVSKEAGTTRDIVDVSIDLQGWLVRLGDMAGVRAGLAPNATSATEDTTAISPVLSNDASTDPTAVGAIEQEGIRRARERALQSDLVVVLVSLKHNPTSVTLDINAELLSAVQECRLAGKDMLFALNKIDLLHEQTATPKISLSRLLSQLMETFKDVDPNDVFCLSCMEADTADANAHEPDPGGLQTFIAGLTRKFGNMTSAAVADGTGGHVVDGETSMAMTPAEAQSYWTASLSVTHRQREYLRECLVHLDNFLETSGHVYAVEGERSTLGNDFVPRTERYSHTTSASNPVSETGFFDTGDAYTAGIDDATRDRGYHVDKYDGLVGEMEHRAQHSTSPALNSPSIDTKIPYNWADTASNTADMEEIDIVTAAEHLRAAADCLAKLTGRGDGVTSGADVEEVLGVVFEK